MAKATYELIGLANFVKDVERLTPAMRQRVEPVVAQTALRVQAHAQALAPRRTGDLASAIEAQGRGLTWRVGIVDEDISARGGTNAAHRNPSVYGVWYEFGFVTRRITKHKFMGPAVDAETATYEQRLADAISQAVT